MTIIQISLFVIITTTIYCICYNNFYLIILLTKRKDDMQLNQLISFEMIFFMEIIVTFIKC